jgi:hypothetical protein
MEKRTQEYKLKIRLFICFYQYSLRSHHFLNAYEYRTPLKITDAPFHIPYLLVSVHQITCQTTASYLCHTTDIRSLYQTP